MFNKSITNFLNHIPFSSEIIGSPRGFYQSTSEYIAILNKLSTQYKGSLLPIYSKHKITRKIIPKCIHGDILPDFLERTYHESPATFLATIPQGRVWSDCTVIAPDDKILADISQIFDAPIDKHPIFKKWKLRPATYFDSTVAVIASFGGDHNYYHWMFDTLPRLGILLSSNLDLNSIDYFFVNQCKYSFHKDTLEILGIPPSKLIECTKITHLKAKNLIIPSFIGDNGHMPKWACNFLRDSFLITSSTFIPQKRIYISRSDAGFRKIINDSQIVNFLSQYGFESIQLASMTVSQQVELFSTASVIVAPHGAGLVNAVFCRPQTKIIELFSPHYINVCFWSLSNNVDLDYYYLLGDDLQEHKNSELPRYQQNFCIDINKLSETLALAKIK